MFDNATNPACIAIITGCSIFSSAVHWPPLHSKVKMPMKLSESVPATIHNGLFSIFVLLIFAVVGCSDGNNDRNGDIGEGAGQGGDTVLAGCADTVSCASNPTLQIGLDRPAEVWIPSDYTPTTRYPLIIVLHGYGFSGLVEALYLGLPELVDTKQYVLVTPNGTPNENGVRFWNATPACCAGAAAEDDNAGVDYSQIDDVAYIRSLIEEAAATYSLDTSRIGLFGHSNGGFMALRMACEASDVISAVISLAGSTFTDAESCAPATFAVSTLAVHGDLDDTIFYDGSNSYPGSSETTKRFAMLAGCDSDNSFLKENVDVDASIQGSETTVIAYPDCASGVEVEQWSIIGGPHIPFPWVSSATDSFVDWLIEHPPKRAP